MISGDAPGMDLLQIEAAKQTQATMPMVDQTLMRQQRLERLQAELRKRDPGGMLL